MSGTVHRLGAVPNEPPPIITADDFLTTPESSGSKPKWHTTTRSGDCPRCISSCTAQGKSRSSTVTAVRYEARRLREAADRMLVASDAIIEAGKAVDQ